MPQFNRAKSLPQTPTTPTIVITEHLAGFELNHEEKKLGESTKMMLKMTKSPSFSAIETTKSQDSFDSMTYQNLSVVYLVKLQLNCKKYRFSKENAQNNCFLNCLDEMYILNYNYCQCMQV